MPQLEHYSPVSGGAVATITANVSMELETRGHTVTVVGPECGEPVYETGLFQCVDDEKRLPLTKSIGHIEARFRGWDAPHEGRFYSKGFALLGRIQPDVVVLSNDLERAHLVKKRLPRARIIVWVHNRCRLRGAGTDGIRHADAFLCCSDYIKNWLTREYGLDARRVQTAHAGIDRRLFYPSAPQHRQPGLRVLFTGRLDRNKGVDRAVQAVSTLRSLGLGIRMSVAGNAWFYRKDGSESDTFQRTLRAAMKKAEVDWLGHVPRRFLPGVMRSHDVALVLSRSDEPFGLVVLESMASGLAVIASPRGGLGEACAGAAMMTDPDAPDGVERLLRTLATDESVLEGWKRRSLERVKTASWNATADVLCSAAGCGAPPCPRGNSETVVANSTPVLVLPESAPRVVLDLP
jgi:glycosyltransferase involved in cell wall biosynthesis